MEDDLAQVSPEPEPEPGPLREMTKALIDACEDAGLLDLVYKILICA